MHMSLPHTSRRDLRTSSTVILAVAGALGLPSPSEAADGIDQVRASHAVRRTKPIRIDGRLDEPAWAEVPATGDFWQRRPKEGAPIGQRTEFRIAYDDQAIYVGVRAFDSAPGEIRNLLHRRDQDSGADWVYVMLDSYGDKRTAFGFGLNAAGVQRDMLMYDDTNEDESWDAVWSGASHIDAEGWTAEYRIPLGQLRFSEDDARVWGVQFIRYVGRTGEQDLWSPTARTDQGFVSKFGSLDGLVGLRGGRRLEVLPYLSGGLGRMAHDDADPFHDAIDPRYGFGLDAKLGLTSAVTVAATINPDFGQVEADPSQVNLSANETYFAEKRPFFLEGTEIFQFSLDQSDNGPSALFYSRRIGAAPHAQLGGDYVDAPTGTTIYGAAKIAGKTADGWAFGLLDAVTAEEEATAVTGATRTTSIVEPLTNYALARVKKDLRGGKTTVGGAVTSVTRALDDTGLENALHDQAVTGGLGLTHRFGHDEWSADARVVASWVHGSQEAIARTQRGFRHLYQRPDATHLDFDPTRTSLGGAGALWEVGRYGGTHWKFGVGGYLRTPGFEANDLGFHGPVDHLVQWSSAGYRDNLPGDHVLNWKVNVEAFAQTSLEPELVSVGGNANVNVQFSNFWSAWGGLGVDENRLDPGATRGGPALAQDRAAYGSGGFATDGRKAFSFETGGDFRRVSAADDLSTSVYANINIQARSNVELSIGPNYSANTSHDQYVDEVADDSGAPHYVFAHVAQETFGLFLRGAWTFTPELSLQLYAQPFVAAGAYDDFKQAAMTRARARDARFARYQRGQLSRTQDDRYVVDDDLDGAPDYAIGVPDFNFRALRANLVLRWQYLPGSTAFLIWSHGQSDAVTDGTFDLPTDLRALGHADGEDVVMVKVSYWLGR